MPDLMLASGLWDVPVDRQRLTVLSAFYHREWAGSPCNIDDICLLASDRNVDPEPLIRMAEAAGELTETL